MGATFAQEGESIDFTPTVDTLAGTVVIQGDMIGVTRNFIFANALGALAVAGLFRFSKQTGAGTSIGAGNQIFWDAGAEEAGLDDDGGANKFLGISTGNATNNDPFLRLTKNNKPTPPPPPFLPSQLPGLLLWQDADDNGTVLTCAPTCLPSTDGQAVAIWSKKGNGTYFDAQFAQAFSGPIYRVASQNGRNTIQYPTSAFHDFFSGTGSDVSEFELQEVTIIIIAERNNSGVQNTLWAQQVDDDVAVNRRSGGTFGFNSSDQLEVSFFTDPNTLVSVDSGGSIFTTGYRAYGMQWSQSGNVVDLLVNNVNVGTGTSGTIDYSTASFKNSLIGASWGTGFTFHDYAESHIAEMVLYDRILTAPELSSIQSYAVSKWAV